MSSDPSASAGEVSRRRSFIGIGWTAGQTWFGVLLQICLMIVLSRLISPREFGEYAIAIAYVSLVVTLAQLGLSAGIVRTPHDFVRSTGAATAIALVTSIIGFAALLAVASNPFWLPTGGEESARLIAALSAVALVAPVQSVSIGILQRRRQFATMAIIEIIALMANACVSVASALAGWGAWALAFGYLAQQFSSAAGAVIMARPAALSVHRTEAVDLLRFSLGFVWLRLIDTASSSLDRLVVSAAAGSAAVGFYQRSASVRTIASTLAMRSMDVFFFPRLAAGIEKLEVLRREVDHAIAMTLVMSAPLSIGIVIAAGEWTSILFGEPWSPAAPLIQVIAVVLPFRAVDRVNAVLARSAGRQGARIVIQLTTLALTLSALYLLAGQSLTLAVTAVSAIVVVMVLPGILLTASILEVSVMKLIWSLVPPLALWGASCGMGFVIKVALGGVAAEWVAAFCAGVVASLGNLILSFSMPRRLFAANTANLIEIMRGKILSICIKWIRIRTL